LAPTRWRPRDDDRRPRPILFSVRIVTRCPIYATFGIAFALFKPGSADMLRITVQPEPDRIRLKLEGDLAGVWVSEVEDSWRATNSMRGGRPLCLDLTGVEHIDRAGRYLLGLMQCSGAQLIASGTSTTELVRTLKDDWPGPQPPCGAARCQPLT